MLARTFCCRNQLTLFSTADRATDFDGTPRASKFRTCTTCFFPRARFVCATSVSATPDRLHPSRLALSATNYSESPGPGRFLREPPSIC